MATTNEREAFCDACQQHRPCSCDQMEADRAPRAARAWRAFGDLRVGDVFRLDPAKPAAFIKIAPREAADTYSGHRRGFTPQRQVLHEQG